MGRRQLRSSQRQKKRGRGAAPLWHRVVSVAAGGVTPRSAVPLNAVPSSAVPIPLSATHSSEVTPQQTPRAFSTLCGRHVRRRATLCSRNPPASPSCPWFHQFVTVGNSRGRPCKKKQASNRQ